MSNEKSTADYRAPSGDSLLVSRQLCQPRYTNAVQHRFIYFRWIQKVRSLRDAWMSRKEYMDTNFSLNLSSMTIRCFERL